MTGEFHEVFNPRKSEIPTALSREDAKFRGGFKIEELVEYLYASADNDHELFEEDITYLHQSIDAAKQKVLTKHGKVKDSLVDQVDALTDLLYLTYGTFSLMGIDPAPVFEIIHQANMGKRFPDGQPHYDPVTNKVVKPPDWEEKYAPEPKIKAEIFRQVEEAKDLQRKTET